MSRATTRPKVINEKKPRKMTLLFLEREREKRKREERGEREGGKREKERGNG